ncbi:LysM peptidoglycan-binding domain-containing protein [Rickettsiales bacterium]|nr:LysM peptidoglycan-binding domain-containing protein [Rickettsiales bacterium]
MKKEILLLLVLISVSFGAYNYLHLPESKEELNSSNKHNIDDEFVEFKTETENFNLTENKLTFDIVRITKYGDAVIAGRSKPNKVINLFDGNEKLANIISDANGEWVWTSESPLGSGIKKLFLRSKENGLVIKSEQTIIIFLDENSKKEPVVFKTTMNGTDNSSILNLEEIENNISLDLVEYFPSGKVLVSGRSKENSQLSFFFDDELVGKTIVDSRGVWKFEYDEKIKYGKINLRIDLISNNNQISLSTPIFMENMAKMINNSENQIVVQPGNSLWRIARKTLGGGIFYSEIYKRNAIKIKNPDMIFPGQVFDLPVLREKINYER